MGPLLEVWRSARAHFVDGEVTEEALSGLADAVQARLGPVVVDRVALVRALAGIEGPLKDEERAAEVGLALGCAAGDRAALARFESEHLARVPAAVAHLRLDAQTLDELKQEVRTRLLVPAGGAPARLLGYAGKGRLHGLLKVIAVRAALDKLESRARDAPGEAGLGALASPERDPELAFLDAHYRVAFKKAFEDAAGTLERRERNWLRLHLLSGTGLEEIARIYGVHRATVVRTLAKARQHLLDETRKGMRRDLGIGLVELDSIMRLVGSRLDASVARVLGSSTSATSSDDVTS